MEQDDEQPDEHADEDRLDVLVVSNDFVEFSAFACFLFTLNLLFFLEDAIFTRF